MLNSLSLSLSHTHTHTHKHTTKTTTIAHYLDKIVYLSKPRLMRERSSLFGWCLVLIGGHFSQKNSTCPVQDKPSYFLFD